MCGASTAFRLCRKTQVFSVIADRISLPTVGNGKKDDHSEDGGRFSFAHGAAAPSHEEKGCLMDFEAGCTELHYRGRHVFASHPLGTRRLEFPGDVSQPQQKEGLQK